MNIKKAFYITAYTMTHGVYTGMWCVLGLWISSIYTEIHAVGGSGSSQLTGVLRKTAPAAGEAQEREKEYDGTQRGRAQKYRARKGRTLKYGEYAPSEETRQTSAKYTGWQELQAKIQLMTPDEFKRFLALEGQQLMYKWEQKRTGIDDKKKQAERLLSDTKPMGIKKRNQLTIEELKKRNIWGDFSAELRSKSNRLPK